MKKSDLTEFAVEEENFKLQIKRETGSAGPPQITSYSPPPPPPPPSTGEAPSPPAAPAQTPPPAEPEGAYVTSPMVGTFYASPSPESPPFVTVGQNVEKDTVVCIIEAMKIMNEIQAEASGSVAEILVENGQPVEYGQKLFRLV